MLPLKSPPCSIAIAAAFAFPLLGLESQHSCLIMVSPCDGMRTRVVCSVVAEVLWWPRCLWNRLQFRPERQMKRPNRS